MFKKRASGVKRIRNKKIRDKTIWAESSETEKNKRKEKFFWRRGAAAYQLENTTSRMITKLSLVTTWMGDYSSDV